MASRFLLTIVLACLLPAPAAARSLLASTWNGNDTRVDGVADDWAEKLIYLDRSRVHMGARNDDRFLYVCIYASDPNTTRQALDHGLTLTLKAKGQPPLKIEFPVAGEGSGAETMNPAVPASPGMFRIKGAGDDEDRSYPMENDVGIVLKTGTDPEAFTYEFKVPLLPGAATPHAIGAGPGDVIEIRLESPREALEMVSPDEGSMAGGLSGGPGYGGGPGSGGTTAGGMGMRNLGAAPPAGLALKASIRLAGPPAGKSAPGR